jgi:uncharacterized protein (TIGR02147 family)
MRHIYAYLQYREFLADWFEEKKRQNPSFSYQVLANKAGFKSKSFFPQVVDGSRGLSSDSLFKLAKVLELSGKAFTYFQALVAFNQAKTNTQKDHYFQQLIARNSDVRAAIMLRNSYDFFAQWYHSSVRELATIIDWGDDYRLLAKKVRPPITVRQARQSIALLKKLKMLTKKGDRWVQTEPDMTTGDTVQSLAVEKFHLQNLNLAAESIDGTPARERDISCLVAGLSPEMYETVKREIMDFRKKLVGLISRDTTPSRVYHISMQLFPTSEPLE